MTYLNIITRKPVFVEIKRKGTEQDGQPDQHPLFARHKGKGLTLGRVEIFEREGGSTGIATLRSVQGCGLGCMRQQF
jgi:hypothetical protein